MENTFVQEKGYSHRAKHLWPLALLGMAAAVLSLLAGPSSPAWRYERSAVLDGEVWRIVTGQLVHLGTGHLLLNLAGLVMIGWVFGPGLRAARWLGVLAGSWVAIGIGFVWLEPQLAWYVGLSGLLHGLLLGAAVLDHGLDARFRGVFIAGVIGKLGWEQWAGALPFTAEAAGGPVVVDAHLYGGIGGLLAGILLWWLARTRAPV